MRRVRGFTLVELVVVILLLAVLGAVLLPRFLDTGDRAMSARLETMAGALREASNLVHAQARLEDRLVGIDTVTVEGASIQLHSGYPRGNWVRAIRYLVRLDDQTWTRPGRICTQPWCGRAFQRSVPGAPAFTGRGGKVWPEGYQWSDECGVFYINNEDGTPPLIGVIDADC